MKKIVLLSIVAFVATFSYAQTPGEIYQAAVPSPNILDPDGDGYTTESGGAYITTDGASESELEWIRIPQANDEPDGDLSTGATCGQSDIVDDPAANDGASFVYFSDPDGVPDSGDEYLAFRLRIATDPIGAFGFSVLIDTDNKIGFSGPNADPNAVDGNPGFEIEVRVQSGHAVKVDNVDGSATGTNISTWDEATHTQKSYALAQDPACGGDPIFYEWYLPWSIVGVTMDTPLGFASATSSSPGSVLDGSASDIGALNDEEYADQDDAFVAAIEAFINTSPTELITSGCIDSTQSVVPTVDAHNDSDNSISGTTSEADDTEIIVMLNGDSIGVTTATSGTWTFNLPTVIVLKEGDLLSATAEAPCELPSDTSSSIRVTGNNIFINEVAVNEYTGQDEWIELYNNADYPIDVSCYTICDGDFCVTLPSVTTIPAKGFLVIGSSTSAGTVDVNVTTCGCITGTFDLDDSSEQLAMFDVNGNIEDATEWGGGDLAGATAVTNTAVGACSAFSNTMPASSDATYETILGSGGNDSCTISRVTDASLTWEERCDSNITQGGTGNTVLNNAPVAVDDSRTTTEDNPVSVYVTANDSDPDGDPLAITIIGGPNNGGGTEIIGTLIYYVPDADFSGLDTIAYMVCDTGAAILCDTAQVFLTITEVNDAPRATDDFELVPENTAETIDIIGNDSDPEGDAFTYSFLTSPTNGGFVDNSDGTITYTPSTSFVGFDFLTYQICETARPTVCDTAVVTFNVGQPCLVINEAIIETSSDEEAVELWNICCYDVNIGCYSISDGDFIMTIPSGTTLSASDYYVLGSTGSYGGIDLKDGACSGCVTGDYSFTASKEQLVLFDETGVIQDAIQWGAGDLKKDVALTNSCGTGVTVPKNSTAGVYENIGAAASFAGASNARTVDSSSTWIEESGFSTTIGTTNGTNNKAPIAVAGYDTTVAGTAIIVDPQSNDTEPDGELMITSIVRVPNFGTATVMNDDSIQYTPTIGLNGDDYIVYQVCDTVCPALCDQDTAYIYVRPCYQTAGDGDWHSTSTWVGGVVPGPDDCVEILSTHDVTMTSTVDIASVTIYGGGSLTTGSDTIAISGDFINGGTLDNSGGTVAFDGTATQQVAGENTFNNLCIDNPNSVDIVGFTQSVTGLLGLNQGTLDLNGNNLVFDNDSTLGGDQGRVSFGGSGVIDGDVTFERYFNNCATDGFTYFASPVYGTTFADWADDIWMTGATGAYDETGWSNTYYYSEADTGAVDSGWVAIKNTGTSVDVGKGYSVYNWSSLGTAPTQISVTGTVSLDPFSFNESFTDDPNRDNSEHDGWNLMGNPYPATLDWGAPGWTKIGCCDYMATYSPCVDDYSSYAGDVGVNGGTGLIPAFQSFWIKATGDVTPDFRVTRDAIANDNQQFFKKRVIPNVLKLKVTEAAGTASDEIAFRLRDDATTKVDIIDAVKFYFPNYKPSMYTKVKGENAAYSINQLPNDTSLKELSVYSRANATGIYNLDIFGIETFETNTCMLIEDQVTGTVIDPLVTSSYTFSQDYKAVYDERFKIKFAYPIQTAVTNVSCNGLADGSITATHTGNGPFTFTWTDASGNVIRDTTKTVNTDELSGVKSGTYYVSVFDGTATTCKDVKAAVKVTEPAALSIDLAIVNEGCNGSKSGVVEAVAKGGVAPYSYKWNNNANTTKITGLTAGEYKVEVVDSIGCKKETSAKVEQGEAVVANFTIQSTVIDIASGDVAQFNNTSTNAIAYTWNFADGEGSNLPSPTHKYEVEGNYKVELLVTNGKCTDTVRKTIKVNSLGLETGQVSVITNSNVVTITAKFVTQEKSPVISIFNMDGQLLYRRTFTNVTDIQDAVNVSALPAGVYYVQLEAETINETSKIAIIK